MSLPYLLAAAALAIAPLAAAPDWHRVTVSDRVVWYMDAASITTNGKWTTVSEYGEYTAVSPTTGVKSVKLQTDYDCAGRAFRNTHIIALAPDGAVLLDLDEGEDAEIQPGVTAGTVVGTALAFACGTDRSHAVRVPDPTVR